MADNKEFYRLDLVISTEGVEQAEKTIKAMDKMLEQTQRRAAALGKTKINPEAVLTDKTSTTAKKVVSKLVEVDKTRANPEVILTDKTTSEAKKVISKLVEIDKTQAKPEVELVDKATTPANKVLSRVERINKAKASPEARLIDRVSSFAKRITQSLRQVDKTNPKPEVRLVDKVSGAATKISGTLNRMARMPYNIVVSVRDMATATIKKITGALTSPLALLGVGGGAAGVTTVGLNMVMEEQSIRSAFKVLLGGEDAAQQRVDELTAFAGKTPYKREEIYESSRILQVFTGNALSTGDELKRIGDIAAGTKQPFGDVALWIGRLYDALESGRPVGEMTSRLQEMGAINGKARAGIEALADSGKDISKTWPIVTQGFSKFDGMMEDMSGNLQNLLLGTRTFFTQNMFKRWGMGIESALSPVLKKFRQWRSDNKETIASIGEWFETAGKNVTTFVLNKVERAIKVLRDLWNDPAFQDADFFGKVGIAWDKLITEPFSNWWASGGEQKISDMSARIGAALGGGIKGFILGALGLFDSSDTGEESVYVSAGKAAGQAFFTSFLEALDPGEILKKIGGIALDKNLQVIKDPSAGNITGAVITNLAIASGAGWIYNKFLKGPLKTGGKVVSWLGGGTKASTAAKAAAGATAAGTSAGAAASAGTAAGVGAAAGATPSRIATYGRRGNFLSKALPFAAGPLRLAGFAYTAYETQKYLDETGISDAVRETPKKVWSAMNTPVSEINGKSTADMSYLENRNELLKSNWNIMTSKDQWIELGNAMLRTWDTLRGVDPEARHRTSSIVNYANSPFNNYPEIFKPIQPAPDKRNFYNSVNRIPNSSTNEMKVQIPEEQIAGIERSLSDLKQQVTIHVNMPPGLVNMTVQQDEINVDEVVNATGQKLRDALRFAQQNIK